MYVRVQKECVYITPGCGMGCARIEYTYMLFKLRPPYVAFLTEI